MDRIKRIKEIVLFIALGFLIFTYVFQSNGVFAEIKLDSILLNSIVNIRYVSIVVLILGIFFDFIYDRDIIQIIVFCGILFLYIYISYFQNNYYIFDFEENQLITYFIAIFAFKKVNYRTIIYYISLIQVFLLIIKFNIFLFTNERIIFQYNMERVRFAFYDLTNTVPYMLLYVYFAYIYIRKTNMTVLEYVLAFALNFISNYIFVCRTVFVIIIIVLCFSILVKCRKISFDQLVGRRIIVALPFLISLVSIILVDLYDEDIAFFRQLNFILNYRLSFSQNALFDRGISLFGNNYLLLGNSLSTSGKLSVWSDLSFLRYLLKYGIIAYVILIIYLTYFAYLIYEKRDLYLYVVFMFMLLFTTFNSDFFCMNYNYLLFVLSYKSFKV